MVWDNSDFQAYYRSLRTDFEAHSYRDAQLRVDVYKGEVARNHGENGVHAIAAIADYGALLIAGPAKNAAEAFETACRQLDLDPDESDYDALAAELDEFVRKNTARGIAILQNAYRQNRIAYGVVSNLEQVAQATRNELRGRINRAKLEAKRRPSRKGVFISHAGHDATLADALKVALQQYLGSDVPIFVASDLRSIKSGSDWYMTILGALRTCEVVISILTPNSHDRPWINYEAGVGDGVGALVIPVVARGFQIADLRPPLQRHQTRSLTHKEEIEALLRDVGERLKLGAKSEAVDVETILRAAKVPDLSRQISEHGLAIARMLCERSQNGVELDPLLEPSEISTLLDLSDDDLAMSVDELEKLGWIATHPSANALFGYHSISPHPELFFGMDPVVKQWSPESDARELARTVVAHVGTEDGISMSALDEILRWGPRRINVAALWLAARKAVGAEETEGGDPYAFVWLMLIPSTRRFAREPDR